LLHYIVGMMRRVNQHHPAAAGRKIAGFTDGVGN